MRKPLQKFNARRDQMVWSSVPRILILVVAPTLFVLSACAQRNGSPLGPHLQFTKIESMALKGNLVGDPWVREMAVLFPPSYFKSSKTRYPVVYYLHGPGSRKDGHRGSVDMLVKLFNMMKEQKLCELVTERI